MPVRRTEIYRFLNTSTMYNNTLYIRAMMRRITAYSEKLMPLMPSAFLENCQSGTA